MPDDETVVESNRTEPEKRAEPKKRYTAKTKPKNTSEELRLALWFIEKIGDPEKAIKIVAGAADAIRMIQAPISDEIH